PPTPRWAPKWGHWASSTATLPSASRNAMSSCPMKENVVIFTATTSQERSGENQSYTYCGGGRMWRWTVPLDLDTLIRYQIRQSVMTETSIPVRPEAAGAVTTEERHAREF